MHFTLVAALALANSAMAAVGVTANPGFNAVFTPESGQSVPAGEPFVVKWSNPEPYTNSLIYIQLLGGESPETLVERDPKLDGKIINSNATQYKWNVSPSLGDDKVYGLRFVLVDDEKIVQYSQPFSISKAADPGPGPSKNAITSTQPAENSVTALPDTPVTPTSTESANSDITPSSESSETESSSESTTSAPFPTLETTTSATSSPSNKIIPSISTPGTNKPNQTSITGGASRVAGSVAAIGGFVAVVLAF